MLHYKNISITDIPGEEWRDVKGYEGVYQVSNLGRIKSLCNDRQIGKTLCKTKPKILRQGLSPRYLKVKLQYHGKRTLPVHRLVAIAFIPNPDNKPEVNHIGEDENGDVDKKDNRVVSLAWSTHSENIIHAFANGIMKPNCSNKGRYGFESTRGKRIAQYDPNGRLIKVFGSARDAGRQTGFPNTQIAVAAKSNKTRTSGGYYWNYE